MFEKYLTYSMLSILVTTNVSAMLGCSQKALDRSVEAHAIAIQEGWPITEESTQSDSQFLSADANENENFNTFLDEEKFDNLIADGQSLESQLSKILRKSNFTEFLTVCSDVFKKKEQAPIVKAQMYILLEHVILLLKKVKETKQRFVMTVFD